MSVKCHACDADNDANLCHRCARQLETAIAELPAGLHQLRITAHRQARVGNNGRPGTVAPEVEQADAEQKRIAAHLRSREGRITLPTTALPFEPAAARLHDLAENAVADWAQHIADQRRIPLRLGPRQLAGPTHNVCQHATCRTIRDQHDLTTTQQCTWLVAHYDHLRQLTDAGDMHRRFRDLSAKIEHAIDRHDPELFAGRCDARVITTRLDDTGHLVPDLDECGNDLYANLDDRTVECTACGAVYDLAKRRKDMISAAADVLATATQIANALTTLDRPVTPSSVRQMSLRNEIFERGRSREHAPMYRLGDVVDVLDRRAERERRKQSHTRRNVAS